MPGNGTCQVWITSGNLMSLLGLFRFAGGEPKARQINVPGARNTSVSWNDDAGNFWLFGGFGSDAAGSRGHLNDLWRYNP